MRCCMSAASLLLQETVPSIRQHPMDTIHLRLGQQHHDTSVAYRKSLYDGRTSACHGRGTVLPGPVPELEPRQPCRQQLQQMLPKAASLATWLERYGEDLISLDWEEL